MGPFVSNLSPRSFNPVSVPHADAGKQAKATEFGRLLSTASSSVPAPATGYRDDFTKFVDSTGLFGQFIKEIADTVLQAGNALTTGLAQFAGTAVSELPPELGQIIVGSNAYKTDNTTPTVGQFFAAAAVTVFNTDAAPPSLTPFTVNGKQMRAVDVESGFAAAAWKTPSNQVIVAYMATNPLSPWGTTFWTNSAFGADNDIMKGNIAPAETKALEFLKSVQAEASKQGIDPQKGVFTTGYSLGGIEAEYAASQTGVGGLAFVSTGLPSSVVKGAATNGSNFVNLLASGDPVSQLDQNFGNDPAVFSKGIEHYGTVVQTGPEINNSILGAVNNLVLSNMPQGADPYDYFLRSGLSLGSLLAGDVSSLGYLGPTQSPASLFYLIQHVLGVVPLSLTSANMSLSEFQAANNAKLV